MRCHQYITNNSLQRGHEKCTIHPHNHKITGKDNQDMLKTWSLSSEPAAFCGSLSDVDAACCLHHTQHNQHFTPFIAHSASQRPACWPACRLLAKPCSWPVTLCKVSSLGDLAQSYRPRPKVSKIANRSCLKCRQNYDCWRSKHYICTAWFCQQPTLTQCTLFTRLLFLSYSGWAWSPICINIHQFNYIF